MRPGAPDMVSRERIWRLVSISSGLLGGLLARRLIRVAYQIVRKDTAPVTPFDPTNPQFSWPDAVLWAAAAGIGLGVAKVVFPKAVVNVLTKYTTTVTGTVTVFKISGSDVSPTVVNAAGAGISIGTVKLVANKAATVQIPAAPITVSGWKAASTPGTIALSTGKVKIDLVVTVQGSPVLMPVTCAPDPSATIATSTVS